jgi:hypothetical protein
MEGIEKELEDALNDGSLFELPVPARLSTPLEGAKKNLEELLCTDDLTFSQALGQLDTLTKDGVMALAGMFVLRDAVREMTTKEYKSVNYFWPAMAGTRKGNWAQVRIFAAMTSLTIPLVLQDNALGEDEKRLLRVAETACDMLKIQPKEEEAVRPKREPAQVQFVPPQTRKYAPPAPVQLPLGPVGIEQAGTEVDIVLRCLYSSRKKLLSGELDNYKKPASFSSLFSTELAKQKGDLTSRKCTDLRVFVGFTMKGKDYREAMDNWGKTVDGEEIKQYFFQKIPLSTLFPAFLPELVAKVVSEGWGGIFPKKT